MYYTFIFLVLSAIGIGCSIPIANANNIPVSTIIFDHLAFLTFCGVVCGILLLIARFLTKRHFNPNSKIWKVPQKEIQFYEKIKLKKWKHIVPDFGNLVNFKKNIDPTQAKNSQFYERFLYENVNASLLHGLDILFSPIFFVFLKPQFYVTIGLTGMLIVFILNIIPVMIQRSLRPRLLKLYNLTKQKESSVATEIVELELKNTL